MLPQAQTINVYSPDTCAHTHTIPNIHTHTHPYTHIHMHTQSVAPLLRF